MSGSGELGATSVRSNGGPSAGESSVSPPPPALAERMHLLLGAGVPAPLESTGGLAPGDEALHAVEPLMRAGTNALATLLRGGCTTRDSALDLLAADALVTYAFEAASWDGRQLDARAASAMARIGALADETTP